MQRLADDTRIPVGTLKSRRWVSSRWPTRYRRAEVSHGVHKILADLPDDAERWECITRPPRNERTGRHDWTEDAAKRAVGQKVNHPKTSAEKVTAIHDLAADEQVAAAAVTDLLRRPDVAFKAMGDGVARHMAHTARAAGEPSRITATRARLRRTHRQCRARHAAPQNRASRRNQPGSDSPHPGHRRTSPSATPQV